MEELREAQLEFFKILSIALETAKIDNDSVIRYLEQQRQIIADDIAIESEKEPICDGQSED